LKKPRAYGLLKQKSAPIIAQEAPTVPSIAKEKNLHDEQKFRRSELKKRIVCLRGRAVGSAGKRQKSQNQNRGGGWAFTLQKRSEEEKKRFQERGKGRGLFCWGGLRFERTNGRGHKHLLGPYYQREKKSAKKEKVQERKLPHREPVGGRKKIQRLML